MKNLIIMFLLIAFSFTVGQQDSTVTTSDKTSPKKPLSEKIYYGGGIGFNFWGDYFRISLEPMVGYKINPKLSAGVKLMYEYIN